MEYCEVALTIDPKHKKTLYRKAKALAYLSMFEDSK